MKREGRKASLHCAIYTRVSTENGLEQEFNSLDNQREASEAYIRSLAIAGSNCWNGQSDGGRPDQSRPNPIDVGRLRHKGQTHVGLPPAIVDQETGSVSNASSWTEPNQGRSPTAMPTPFLQGNRIGPSHAAKGGRRWRYYVSRALLKGRKSDAGSVTRTQLSAQCEFRHVRSSPNPFATPIAGWTNWFLIVARPSSPWPPARGRASAQSA